MVHVCVLGEVYEYMYSCMVRGSSLSYTLKKTLTLFNRVWTMT